MKKTLFPLFILVCSIAVFPHASFAQAPANSPVTIPDANLRAAIAEALGKPADAQLTASDMSAMTKLIAHDADVRDLTGLEHAGNLENLDLNNSSLSDISALSELTRLKYLYLPNNNISDVAALSGLTKLTYLYLGNNLLNDISALSELTKLKGLGLSDNNISDVSALSGLTQLEQLALNGNGLNDVSRLSRLTQLTDLDLAENNISDVAALSGLTQLRRLALGGNSLTDVSPLTGFTQSIILLLWGNSISDISALESLPQQTILDLWNNPLSYTVINTHIPAMQAKGVNVSFTPRTPATLLKVSGDSQQGSANTPLPQPFVVEVRDQNDRDYAGVPVTFRVATGDGQLSVTTTQTDSNGKAQSHLTLGRTPTTTVSVTAAEVAQSVLFASATTPTDGPVSIPDVNLRARIAERLGKPSEAQLTVGNMLNLTALNGEDADIQDLTGLEHAYNLTELYLSRNSVTDVSALAGLTQLINLTLDDNSVSDISALAGLTHLNELRLVRNSVTDISALAGLTKLRGLSLGVNGISDVSALAELKQLIELGLGDNNITDVSAISGLTRLKVLSIGDNNITDVIAVSGLTELSVLSLNGNNITDVSAISGLTRLRELYIGDNNITDATAVSGLTELSVLSLNGNNITDVSAISRLTRLRELYISDNNITDVSAISELTRLNSLYLGGNSISDISDLEFLTQLTHLDLGENPLNYAAINALLPAMQAKGVNVYFSPRTPTTLVGVSEATQRGIFGPTSPLRLVVEVRDQHDRAFAGVPVTFRVTSGDSELRPTTAETDLDGRAQTYLTLAGATGTTTVSVTAAEVSQPIQFTATAVPIIAPLTIPDVNLRRKIAYTLDKPDAAQLTAADVLTLTQLDASESDIQDLTGLEHAQNLKVLNLFGNSVTDLAALGSLTRLTELNLSANPLNYSAINTHIPALRAIGVEIAFDPRAPTKMVKISGEAQEGLINTAMPLPFVVEVRDQRDRAYAGVPVAFRVTAGDGQLDAADTSTDLNGRAQARFTFGQSTGTVTVSVTAAGISNLVQFTATAINPYVSVPDANLRVKITDALGKPRDAQLIAGDMLRLTRLNVFDAGIHDLTGLELAHGMTFLEIGFSSISDLTPLAGLTRLTHLSLSHNRISDVSPLAGLTQLTYLYLNNNLLTDVSALAGLTQLTTLSLEHNGIVDVSPLSGLTQLTSLRLNRNIISDVSPLSALTKLTSLSIDGNRVSDVSSLAGLTQLTSLGLSTNSLNDVSPLAGLTQLISLGLSWTNLVDVSPLAELTRLERLGLSYNRIRDVSPLAGLTQLTSLGLSANSLSDVSALSGMTRLITLDLASNLIRDVSPLAGLTQLTWLDLSANSLSDVTALSEMTRLTDLGLNLNRITDVSPLTALTQLTSVSLTHNPLSYVTINTHIPAMQAKGVDVEFDLRTPTTLAQVSAAARQGVANTTLPLPFVVEVRDQEDSAFAGAPVTFRITAGGGQLSATTVTTDDDGAAEVYFTPGLIPETTTVSVSAAGIPQSVRFTATAHLATSPVSIPDTNLRAKIAEALGKQHDGAVTAQDMSALTTFNANNADIRDLTGLQHAYNLSTLSLSDNSLTDLEPLMALTQLKTLSLNNNRVSDLEPLAALTELISLSLDNNMVWDLEPLTGLSRLATLSLDHNNFSDLEPLAALHQLNTLRLRGNWLDDLSYDVHIPAMQAKGADVRFDTRPQYSRPIVRLIYFLPRDRRPQPDIEEKLDQSLKDAQQFYAEQMEAHGFGRKTFQIETDATGKAVVRYVKGRFPDSFHRDRFLRGRYLDSKFDYYNNIVLAAADFSTDSFGGTCGTGFARQDGGYVQIAASESCFFGDYGNYVVAHELGHAFGLHHDFRNSAYLMGYGFGDTRLSYEAAEWFNVHRAFNPGQSAANAETTSVKMLPPSRAVSSNAVRLRFEVSDADGLHQAQLVTSKFVESVGTPELVSAKPLNGSKNATVEFVTTEFTSQNILVGLLVIDLNGNVALIDDFPFDISFVRSRPIHAEEPAPIAEDANGDGVVNIQDLVLVSSRLGQTGQNSADVNGDGVVNIQDLVAVAAVIGGAAAPAAIHQQMSGVVTAADVEGWITQAHSANLTDPKSRRGIRFLQHLLAMFIPKETALLPNYPNPFNPETWIPYQLAAPAEVTLEIHAVDGSAVRALELGHQLAGIYQGKSRAAYWDGRNAQGERVASGIYFYTLSAGDFSATRKMLIRK